MSETGADYLDESITSTEDDNEDKNHNHQNDVFSKATAAQPGMLLSEGRDGRVYHIVAVATGDEVLKVGTVVCLDNEAVCLDNEIVTMPYS